MNVGDLVFVNRLPHDLFPDNFVGRIRKISGNKVKVEDKDSWYIYDCQIDQLMLLSRSNKDHASNN